MESLENIVQIISILVFVTGGITFFFKTGRYKTNIDTKLNELQKDIEENKLTIKEMQIKINNMQDENNKIITNLNSSLVEIKAKLEFLVKCSGMFDGNNRNKK